MKGKEPVTGRFDRSFVVRMIRDFLIALTLIIVLELGARLAIAQYEFQVEDEEVTQSAAESLASDIRDIMLNRGGPVAARTIYPILSRNYEDLGLEIAIVPSRLTVESIRSTVGIEARGVPPDWSEGTHHEASVTLHAEEFCITCHSLAEPGDPLGRVIVRSYRDQRMEEWWAEARVTGVVGMGNVLVHTLVLFLLLRIRMEPLLQLRTTLAKLARGRLDLSRRADVRSEDEFGGLASDLNEFLDRLQHLLEDLDEVLRQVAAVNTRLEQVSEGSREQLGALQAGTREALKSVFQIREMPEADRLQALDALGISLVELARLVEEDRHYAAEIVVLEDRMQSVASEGRKLVGRIRR